ncbi:MAG: hypothetical protein JW712_11590 [Dehalococcoidales bacterium]|nr:hypothetical protein [Dehalococcoidales bacterium]
MVSTIFDDSIVSATELKKNQKYWFDKAYSTPVSITSSKGRNYVLINREQIGTVFKAKEISEELIRYCYELKKETETGFFTGDVFPWARFLNQDERMEFGDDLMKAFVIGSKLDDFELVGEVISEWKATAEALSNAEFMEVINTESSDRSYTEVD